MPKAATWSMAEVLAEPNDSSSPKNERVVPYCNSATRGSSPRRVPGLEKQLKELEEKAAGQKGQLLQEEVTPEEIAEVVARWTGIPVTRLIEGEKEKLLRLDKILHERVISSGKEK
jgi:ATP-dependent Clp protease ATP-binding subunit ClpA